MKPDEWRKLTDALFNRRASSFERSRAFSRFIQSDATLLHLDIVSNLLADENQTFRNDVLRQVVRNVRPEYFPILATCLGSPDEHVVREALRGLEGCHDPEIIAKVARLAETGKSCIHYEAERVLRKMRDGVSNWETLAEDTSGIPTAGPAQEDLTREPEAGRRPFIGEKTAEITLSLNMLPTDTPYPVHRSSRSKKGTKPHHLPPKPTTRDHLARSVEGVVAALVSLGAILLVALISMSNI